MSIHPAAKVFLICICGFLLSLSAPGYDLWFLAWIGLVPLFIAISTSKKLIESLLYSFLFGFAYNFCYLHWILSIHPLSWLGFNNTVSLTVSFFSLLVAAFCNSVFFVLFAILVTILKQLSVNPYNKGIPNLVLITFIWLIVFNKISCMEMFLGFPWTLVEYSQYKNLHLIQIAEYLGSISISFLIVFFNLVLANLVLWFFNIEKIGNRNVPKHPGQFGDIVTSFSFILILISLSLIFGVASYKKNQESFSSKSRSISLVQGNLSIKTTRGETLDMMLANKIYGDLIKNTNASLIIAPEAALPTLLNYDLATQSWIKNLSRAKNVDIISGSYCRDENMLTNCAISHSSNKLFFYEKEILVPFGEYTPYSFLLPRIIKKLASNALSEGFKKGKKNSPLETSIGKAGVSICFEIIFPTLIRKQSLQDAKFLVNLSDLSWFSNSRVRQQFLAFGVFRAIENRKPLVIATNNGISAFIDPIGKIKNQSLPNTQGVLIDWINPSDKITFYAKYGW